MARFMQDGIYSEWASQERDPERLAALSPRDPDRPAADLLNRDDVVDELLRQRRRELRAFIGQVARSASKNMYAAIVRHSTSLQWIYNKIRADYDIQQKGVHFLNVVELQYDPDTKTPASFYNEYRTLLLNNVGRRNEVIRWNEGIQLQADEVIGPLFEDVILLQAIQMIDPRLPKYIKEFYQLKMGERRLMDLRTDIFNNIKRFLSELDAAEQLHSIRLQTDLPPGATSQNSPTLAAFNSTRNQRQRGRGPGIPQPSCTVRRTFCKVCYEADKGRSIYLSHEAADSRCPTRITLNTIADEALPPEVIQAEEEPDDNTDEDKHEQVVNKSLQHNKSNYTGLSLIQPVPTQLLTLTDHSGSPIHIELDSAATVNFITYKEAKTRNFTIYPNDQSSKLGDGSSTIKACGEISTILYRDSLPLIFKALICHKLHCNAIGGTLFIKTNGIKQDFNNNTISLAHDKKTVPATTVEATMPVKSPTKPVTGDGTKLISIKTNKIVSPGDSMELETNLPDQTVLVEGWNGEHWPDPQLASIKDGILYIDNPPGSHTILSKKKVNSLKLTPVTYTDWNTPAIVSLKPDKIQLPTPLPDSETISQIKIGNTTTEIKETLDKLHRQYRKVFGSDLTGGYNGYFGPHKCHLNWASDQRPEARKIPIANYNSELKAVMQEICDDLTAQGVLKIPQNHNIRVQSVCPSFLRRKRKAKDKPIHLLTKNDCRLVVNFNPINDHIKNLPTAMMTVSHLFVQLGKWKHLIVMDLQNTFFQNHIAEEDQQWLGIMTPYSGLRVLARSGQGLLGQSEELDELLAKILGVDIKEGKAIKIQDDIIIGGDTQEQTIKNYAHILEKLYLANMRVEPGKTIIFPKSVDIAGWIWENGRLSVSPHRRSSLINTREEDIKKVKDMRSFIGLYKTLHMATPAMSRFVTPLEDKIKGLQSNDKLVWDHSTSQRFREAKSHIQTVHTLYLPHPDEQLVIKPDAASNQPGIGHTLFAVKDGELIPVRFYSAKLSDQHRKWSLCEIEALSLASAVESEYNLLRESKLPIMILPDSKPVQDSINLIKRGKFSASSRMNRFLTNINKIPIPVKHLSEKYNLNLLPDHQSRHPSACTAETCSIHKFINELSDTVIDPASRCSPIKPDASFFNRAAWKAAQDRSDSCRAARSHLTSGKVPLAKGGDLHNEIRFLIRNATIAPDGLLITKGESSIYTPGEPREKIVVPHNVAPGTLYHMHHSKHFTCHPSQNQLRAAFNRRFYTWNLQPLLDKLYENCYMCSIIQRQPKVNIPEVSQSHVPQPHKHFHADVIKRAGQLILVIIDHFTLLVVARLVPSEKTDDLIDGLINLTTPIRHPGPITIISDWAPGFISAAKHNKFLSDLHITLSLKDLLNKNFNAVIDRACQDIEGELRKISPEGQKINQSILAKATIATNSLLRRKEGISAFELHTARSQDTGCNLQLDDSKLFSDQLKARSKENKSPHVADIRIGDTVTPYSSQNKHTVRNVYLVTGQEQGKVITQRSLHPLSETPIKFMAREYRADPKHLRRIHRPATTVSPDKTSDVTASKSLETSIQSDILNPPRNISSHRVTRSQSNTFTGVNRVWTPYSDKYFEEESSDEEEEDVHIHQNVFQGAEDLLTPPPSHNVNPPPDSSSDSDQLLEMPDNVDLSFNSQAEELVLEYSDSSLEDREGVSVEATIDSESEQEKDYLSAEEDDGEQGTSVQDRTIVLEEEEALDDAVEHVRQFTPEKDGSEEEVMGAAALMHPHEEDDVEDDMDEIVDDPVEPVAVENVQELDFLKNYTYDQSRNIKKKDTIYYYDLGINDFIRAQVISKSNFKDYYNIKFPDTDRPKCGIYFRKGDF